MPGDATGVTDVSVSVQSYVETYAGVSAAGKVRLNIMSGLNLLEGWVNIDPFSSPHPTIKHIPVLKMDPRRLDFPDNSVDEISSVSLEHIPHPETLAVLVEWFRVLKPGAALEVLVPDAEWGLSYWLSLPEEEKWGFKLAAVCGLQNNAGQVHYTLFTPARLKRLFEAVGFSDVVTKLEWSPWTETQKLRCRGVKRQASHPSSDNQSELAELGGVSTTLQSAGDDTTLYFLGNPLPNVDYDWIHNMVMIPKWKGELERLRSEVEHLIQKLTLSTEVTRLQAQEKERLALESQSHAAKAERLAGEMERLAAQVNQLSQAQTRLTEEGKVRSAELEYYKSFYERVVSMPFVSLAMKLRRVSKGLPSR